MINFTKMLRCLAAIVNGDESWQQNPGLPEIIQRSCDIITQIYNETVDLVAMGFNPSAKVSPIWAPVNLVRLVG